MTFDQFAPLNQGKFDVAKHLTNLGLHVRRENSVSCLTGVASKSQRLADPHSGGDARLGIERRPHSWHDCITRLPVHTSCHFEPLSTRCSRGFRHLLKYYKKLTKPLFS